MLQGVTAVQPGRNQPTRELLHVAFSISQPRQRVVFARPFNPAQAVAEVIWILSGGNASGFLQEWNPRLKEYLDAGSVSFHGAYGYRLGSWPSLPAHAAEALRVGLCDEPKIDQLRAAFEALSTNADSRQVVLQIWNAEMDMPNPAPRSRDIPCNIVSHPMIRNGRLEWLQVMRSNDLFWGTPINFIQFMCLQEIMAGWLDVDVGEYVHVSDSLHVYERHWLELDGLELEETANRPTNSSDLRIVEYAEWEQVFAVVAMAAVQLSDSEVNPDSARGIVQRVEGVPSAYAEWIALLAAESLRKRGYEADAADLIVKAGEYWMTSWLSWYERKKGETPRRRQTRALQRPLNYHSSGAKGWADPPSG
jgi:thymidylate synthase